ncbi:unnamed protein product [[Actinomadura] parvosata subsp. kistnae]|nr:unnamed protein product [Actinomadura parvosata subsp. kistnae]
MRYTLGAHVGRADPRRTARRGEARWQGPSGRGVASPSVAWRGQPDAVWRGGHGSARCGAAQRDATWRVTAERGAARPDAVARSSAERCGWRGEVQWHGHSERGVASPSAMRRGAAGTAQRDAAWRDTTTPSAARRDRGGARRSWGRGAVGWGAVARRSVTSGRSTSYAPRRTCTRATRRRPRARPSDTPAPASPERA